MSQLPTTFCGVRVVYDYGLTPISAPRSSASSSAASANPGRSPHHQGSGVKSADRTRGVGAQRAAAAPPLRRETPVVIIHVGEGARRAREGGAAAGPHGRPAENGEASSTAHGRAAYAAAIGGVALGPDGIPVPGTPYVLTASEEAESTDRAVRSHERSHQMTLGPYAESGVILTTRRGPGGEVFAVGGRIAADLSPVPGNPRATLRKANAVRRAAMSPGSPSAADMRVAAEAYRLAQSAREELRNERLNLER